MESSAPSASPVTPAPTLPLTGAVSGTVKDDDGTAIPDVPLELQTPGGVVIATTTTNDMGEYLFTNVPPGDYNIIEVGLPSYPVDVVSDYDTLPDGDAPDADTKVDNIIGVTVEPREVDSGNDFVDTNKGCGTPYFLETRCILVVFHTIARQCRVVQCTLYCSTMGGCPNIRRADFIPNDVSLCPCI